MSDIPLEMIIEGCEAVSPGLYEMQMQASSTVIPGRMSIPCSEGRRTRSKKPSDCPYVLGEGNR